MKSEQLQNHLEARAEMLARPVLRTIIEEIEAQVDQNPALADRLKWVGVSGSKARQAELGDLNGGVVSDDDLVILLGDAPENDPLNLEAYEMVLDALNHAAARLIREHGISPVFASTIRLEDAQMALAKICDTSGGKLHMVHSLIYPSAEAAIAFEPPKLVRGLFGQSLGLMGDDALALELAEMARNGAHSEDHNLTIGGLDGISDNFRLLKTNQHVLPAMFLGPQTVHVLDYSLKWAMASVVEREMGIEPGTWEEIISHFPTEAGGDMLISLVEDIRSLRQMADDVDLSQVEAVYKRVISLWPVLTNIRLGNAN